VNIAVSQSGQAILFTSEGHPCGHSDHRDRKGVL